MQLPVPYKDYTSNTTTLLQGLPIQLGTYRNYLPTFKRIMQISLQGLYNYYGITRRQHLNYLITTYVKIPVTFIIWNTTILPTHKIRTQITGYGILK